MTLFNQINSLLLGLFLLVMTSLAYFQFTQTQTFMNEQMESDLNNTTQALTLMLKPHLETGDLAATETVINVIFEGGFYKQVSLTWLSGEEKQEWTNTLQANDVPEWFLSLNLFDVKKTEKTITSGWMQLAILEIESNPAIAYSQLWHVMYHTLIALVVLFFLALLILYLRLKKILEPLNRVTAQATLIANREFQPDLPLPKTTDLKEVILAINSMSNQLEAVFTKLDKETVALKHERLTDNVSQLPNRYFLNSRLQSWISEPGYGGLLIAKLDWLEDIREEYGYQVRDKTIQILAKELQQQLSDQAPSVVARISNTEFAFLVTKASSEQLKIYLQACIRIIKEAMHSANVSGDKSFVIGAAIRGNENNASELLSRADKALQKAIKEEKISHFDSVVPDAILTQDEWAEVLKDAIENRSFLLQWHPVISSNNKVLQHEIYCRLPIENNIIRAAQFMPNVEILKLGKDFDCCLIKLIVNNAMVIEDDKDIAINITQDSIQDKSFHSWFSKFFSLQSSPERFYFELKEETILLEPELSVAFARIVKRCGANIGVDNCGRSMGSLSYLQKIKPRYVKLDNSLCCSETDDIEYAALAERIELTEAVIHTTRGLGIDVIVTGIENQQQLNVLNKLKPTGYQGFIVSPVDIS